MLRTRRMVLANAPAADPSVLLRLQPRSGMRRWVLRMVLAAAVGAGVGALAAHGLETFRLGAVQTQRFVPRIDLHATLFPVVRLDVLLAANNQYAPWSTNSVEVVSSAALWQRMHLMEWNSVPESLRIQGLDNMLGRYRDVLLNPATWDRMTAYDWDAIPQPVRTAAYRHMLDYWAGFYGVGSLYGLPPRTVADTLAAIAMSESWFDHRATVVNAAGNRDLGLAQASDFARERMRTFHDRGVVDAYIADADYYNPWMATRFIAIWMSILLDEAEGDLDLAVRAYHRGISSARDRRGDVYADTVSRRLSRYIRNQDAPSSWDYVWRRTREMARAEWQWLAPRPVHAFVP